MNRRTAFAGVVVILLAGLVVALLQMAQNGRYTVHHEDSQDYIVDSRSGVMFLLSGCPSAVPATAKTGNQPDATTTTGPRVGWEDILAKPPANASVTVPCAAALDLKTGKIKTVPFSIERTQMPSLANAGN